MKIKANFYYVLLFLALVSNAAAPSGAIAAPAKAAKPAQEASYDPDANLAGSYLSGQFARANGDFAEAITHLKRVHASDPDNAELTSELQGMLLMQGQVDEAITLSEDIHDDDEKDSLSSLLLALRDIKHKRTDKARSLLEASFDSSSGQLWMPLLRGWLDAEAHTLTKPLAIDTLGVDIGTAGPLINYHLALINNYAGFKDAAVQNFKAAVDDPLTAPPRIVQVMLEFYRDNGKPDALKPLAESYFDAHPVKSKEPELPTVATLQDGVAEVLYTMGGVMLGAGVTNDSIVYLQLALYIKPDFADAQLALGDAFSDLQQYAQANASYGHVPVANRLHTRAQLHVAVNYDRMGKLKEALAMLDKISAHAADPSDALVTKGDLLRIHGRYNEAIDIYTAAIKTIPELKPDDWAILFARGSSYERQGKWDAAEKDLRQALALKPDQPDVLNYLGYGWLERGQHLTDARKMLEKAVKARPNDPQIVDSMGWALYLMGDYSASAEYLEKAVELMPVDATVNDHLGDAYWRLGRKTEARYQWERSLTCSPEAQMASNLQRKLKEGLPPALANTVAASKGKSASALP